MAETAPISLRHSCGSELTRQGISLETLLNRSMIERRLFLCLPACRHADGTISSPEFLRVRRVVSEDSARIEQPFLLIVRTRRVVTAVGSSAGFSEFPAYSRISLRQRFHLRTVHRCCSSTLVEWLDWVPALMVAHEIGPSHPSLVRRPGVWPLRILLTSSSLSC